jgi:hypothetical protein
MDLDLTVAGAYSTRQFEHIFDLSARLFYKNYDPVVIPGQPTLIPIHLAKDLEDFLFASPVLPDGTTPNPYQGIINLNLPNPLIPIPWQSTLVSGKTISSLSIPRYQNFEELAQDAGHLRTRLSGITGNDFEWSIDAFAEKYETNLGHVGHQWERDEYNLEFRGNRPFGDRNHLAFGLGYRYMEFDVTEVVTSPWDFDVYESSTSVSPLSIPGYNSYPILNYGGPDSFERFSAFVQNTFEVNEDFFFSFGSKFEDGDFSGTTFQPGVRASYSVNSNNLLWGAYSRAHRQASLVEKYTEVSYARFWYPTDGKWVNESFNADPTLDDEVMDAYEIGWRSSPSEKLLWELSLFYYDTQDAVFSGPPIYNAFDYTSLGGELTFNYIPNEFWELQGSYSYSEGKKEGESEKSTDFPESMASLKSLVHAKDNLKFVQNLYFTGDRILPSAYNELPIDDYLRLDLGMIWQVGEGWQIGLFGQDLLDPDHPENMYTDLDVEPTRIERRFLLSISKEF